MSETGETWEVLGAPGAAAYLERGEDPCFGRRFAKAATACIACRAPVRMHGKLHLLRELCAARTRGAAKPTVLKRLSSLEVQHRLEEGKTYREIFLEILGSSPPRTSGAAARQLLLDRLHYLQEIGALEEKPQIPPTKILLAPPPGDS